MADASNNPTNDQQKPSDEAQANIKEEEVTMKEEEPEPVAADVLEEDDEFEEFQDEDWAQGQEQVAEEDELQWEDNWDDEEDDDDFGQKLRATIENAKK